MSVIDPANFEKIVTVIESADDDPNPKPRQKMTLKEAYNKIDNSKQYSYCARCKHDIRDHASTEDYLKHAAGRCEFMFDEGIRCVCPQYYFSGITKTQKEIDSEKLSN